MLRTHRAGKSPGGYVGWGLGSRNRRGPGVPPTPGLRGWGTSPGSPAGFLGSSWWSKCPPLLSSSGLWWPLPPASPDLPCYPPVPPVSCVAWRGLWKAGYQPGNLAGSPARVGQAVALHSSPALPRVSLPPASPDLPGLRGTDPFWSPLLLPPQSPYVLPVHFGVPPVSLGIRIPHQPPARALVVGRQ